MSDGYNERQESFNQTILQSGSEEADSPGLSLRLARLAEKIRKFVPIGNLIFTRTAIVDIPFFPTTDLGVYKKPMAWPALTPSRGL